MGNLIAVSISPKTDPTLTLANILKLVIAATQFSSINFCHLGKEFAFVFNVSLFHIIFLLDLRWEKTSDEGWALNSHESMVFAEGGA